MAEAAADVDVEEDAPKKKGKKGLLIGLVAMLLLGGGGFFVTFSGIFSLPFGGGGDQAAHEVEPESGHDEEAAAEVAFVEIPEMLISLGPSARSRYLRLSATLEIDPARQEEVTKLMPRVQDVINSYLQALDEADVERPAAMARMRAHLLRRIRIVAGEDAVRDLLVTEFVLQ